MQEQQFNNYELAHGQRTIELSYRNHEFASGRGFRNGTGAYTEKDFAEKLGAEIDRTIALLSWLQQVRKESEKIAAKHAAARTPDQEAKQ